MVPPPAKRPRFGSITPKVATSDGDPEVASAEHLHASGHARPVDRGDDRLVELDVAEDGLDPVVETVAVDLGHAVLSHPVLHLRDLGDVRLEVGPDAEVLADPGDDRDPRIVVVAEALPRSAELREVLHIERIAGLWPVDGDQDDVVVALLVVNGHGEGLGGAYSSSLELKARLTVPRSTMPSG